MLREAKSMPSSSEVMRSCASMVSCCRRLPIGRPRNWTARVASDTPSIRDTRLGWDITDYGKGRFSEFGLVLFTLRNGLAAALADGRGMLYAEKLMITAKDQVNPLHRHAVKTEDIITAAAARWCCRCTILCQTAMSMRKVTSWLPPTPACGR